MEERTQKLLLLAGDEGAANQPRDFKKIVQIIVEEYLAANNADTSKKIVQIFTNIIGKIPLKQHIYAGLTAKISQKMKQQSNQIILSTLKNLEQALSNFQFYESLNLINYLSELMNISLLNSLTFMNILQDIADKIESEHNPHIKRFYISILVRSLPVCISSLSEKLFQDLKKFMDQLQAHAHQDPLFSYMKKQFNKGETINYSLMDRLGQNFTELEQVTIKMKIKIEPNLEKLSQWTPVEYFNLNRSNQDELYRQFVQEQGRIHLFVIQQLIETFYPRNNILTLKIQNYLHSIAPHKQTYLYQLIISGLLSKSLKSSRPIVEQSLLLFIINSFDMTENNKMQLQSSNLTKNDICKMLSNQILQIFTKGEGLDFNSIINVANLISFIINNWKEEWDWERFVENQETFVKRKVLLSLILQKVKFLNDNFEVPQALAKFPQYQTPAKLTNQHEYQSTEDMQIFQNFQNALKSKSNSEVIIGLINNQHHYEIFLQALFRRTSLSQTHLKTLMQRYKDVFKSSQEYDWTLINKIRNFWKRSYLNRQIYLQLAIKSEFVTYESYVKYIEQLKDKNEKEMTWIKVELNQLNNIFGNHKKGK